MGHDYMNQYKQSKSIVLKTEWYTQLPARPLIGIISVWDGEVVKQYIGTNTHEDNISAAIKEISEYGAKYREYSQEDYQRLYGIKLPKVEE